MLISDKSSHLCAISGFEWLDLNFNSLASPNVSRREKKKTATREFAYQKARREYASKRRHFS